MLAPNNPQEAYRRSAFDARVQGGDTAALVDLCLEQAVDSLAVALSAEVRGENALRSRSLTKAITAITALEMGVDSAAPLAQPLFRFYRAARQSVLDSVLANNRPVLSALKTDLADLRDAFRHRDH